MNLYFASSGLARGEGEWYGRPGWQNGQKGYFKLRKKIFWGKAKFKFYIEIKRN